MKPLLIIEETPASERAAQGMLNGMPTYRASLGLSFRHFGRSWTRIIGDFREFMPSPLVRKIDERHIEFAVRSINNRDYVQIFAYGSRSALEEQNREEHRQVLLRSACLYAKISPFDFYRGKSSQELRHINYSPGLAYLFPYRTPCTGNDFDEEYFTENARGPFMMRRSGYEDSCVYALTAEDMVLASLLM